MTRRKPTPSSSPTASSAPDSNSRAWSGWDLAVVALFLCRLLVPAEGTEQGHTLWIASAWLALGTLRLWSLARQGREFRLHVGLTDLGVLLLIGGELISAGISLAGSEDRRALLNSSWEWVSLGVMWCLLKDRLHIRDTQRLINRTILITAIVLSGYGIWQHFVWYPQQSRDLTELLELQGAQLSQQPMNSADRTRFNELRSRFGSDVLMLEEGGRQMLLARTRDSREPIGRFALANTFAALLLVGWFLAADLFWNTIQLQQPRRALGLAILALTLITICLLLTKSRTGIVGLFAALGILTIRLSLTPGAQRRFILIGALGALGIALLMGIILSLSGGLDLEVLSEAPKSLSYRLEYWSSTWRMIQDHLLFGVGPGNFRPHYFAYKLPGSSEEILDPHNMVLEAWATGGVLSLMGLSLILVLWIRRLISAPLLFVRPEQEKGQPLASSQSLLGAGLTAGIMAFALILVVEWLLEGFFDEHLTWLAVGWMLTYVLFAKWCNSGQLSIAASLGAGTAIFVHLLGAGGLGMPAVLQLLLLLILTTTSRGPSENDPRWSFTPLLAGVAGGGCALLFFGALWTGVVPVLTAKSLLEQSRQEWLISRRIGNAEKYLRMAASADSLSAEPHNDLASLLFQRWMDEPADNAELFAEFLQEKQLALSRNPRSPKEYVMLSECWLKRYDKTREPAHAQAAVETAQIAADLYPHDSRVQWQLAESAHLAGQSDRAREHARRAEELNELNRAKGHIDKLLSKTKQERLAEILRAPT